MSSPTLPQPPPPNGPPPSPPSPPPSPPSPPSSPPPSPPPSTPTITSANYFFGFVITFVVLLLLFVGCGLGSWRRLRLVGTAWDAQLQDMEGNPFGSRKRARRRHVRPTFQDVWTTAPTSMLSEGAAYLAPCKWADVQPVSAALVWSRSTLTGSVGRRKSDANPLASSSERGDGDGGAGGSRLGGPLRELGVTLRSYVFPQRPRGERPPSRPPPVQRRPPPEAVQVVVMVAMPSQSPLPPSSVMAIASSSGRATDESGCKYVGQPGVGEYQIGVVRIPWPSGEGP